MLVLFLDHEWDWCRVKTSLKLFDATLLDSSECHLHCYDFRHSLNVISFFCWTLNEINSFKNVGAFKINYFPPKLLESYGTLLCSSYVRVFLKLEHKSQYALDLQQCNTPTSLETISWYTPKRKFSNHRLALPFCRCWVELWQYTTTLKGYPRLLLCPNVPKICVNFLFALWNTGRVGIDGKSWIKM